MKIKIIDIEKQKELVAVDRLNKFIDMVDIYLKDKPNKASSFIAVPERENGVYDYDRPIVLGTWEYINEISMALPTRMWEEGDIRKDMIDELY